MNKHGFKLHVADLLPRTLEEVKGKLAESSAKLADIHFTDLFVEHRPDGKWPLSSGVYLFFDPDYHGKHVCTYVGKSEQSFATRIGAHFGDRTMKNLYLKSARTPTLDVGCEDGHYAPRLDELFEHKLTLVNAYNWAHTKEGFMAAGVEAAQIESVYPGWGVPTLRTKMEHVLQAAFCPPEGTDPDWFINMPKNRNPLHALRDRMAGMPKANFAQLLLLK